MPFNLARRTWMLIGGVALVLIGGVMIFVARLRRRC